MVKFGSWLINIIFTIFWVIFDVDLDLNVNIGL